MVCIESMDSFIFLGRNGRLMDKIKRTSVQIYSPTYIGLIKIQGVLQAEEGKKITLDEVIMKLIKYWNEAH